MPEIDLKAPIGAPPVLEYLAPGELEVDPSYQRSIETEGSQRLIRRIAHAWDWGLCQPLEVARRPGGELIVVDGQHRLRAAKLRGDIQALPCVIKSFSSSSAEAAAFVALNQERKQLTQLEVFRARLAAEDPAAQTLARLLTLAGLTVAPHTNYQSWQPGMVSNVAGLQEIYKVHGEGITAIALKALAEAFDGQVLRYAGTIFPGIATFVADRRLERRPIVGAVLVQALKSRSQADWRREITAESARSGNHRRAAAKTVVSLAYSIACTPVRVEPDPAPALAPLVVEPPPIVSGAPRWCDQCDQRVSAARAAACGSTFCKAKGR